jgi:hypothetical protein
MSFNDENIMFCSCLLFDIVDVLHLEEKQSISLAALAAARFYRVAKLIYTHFFIPTR